MPCTDPDMEAYEHRLEFNTLKEKVNLLTQLLCTFCQKLTDSQQTILFTPEVAKWWKEHQTADAIRKAKEEAIKIEAEKKKQDAQYLEKLKKVALKKLSPEEKKVLGLKLSSKEKKMLKTK